MNRTGTKRRDDVAITLVYPIVKTLRQKGLDPDAFFRRVSFDAALLRDPDARMPGGELERLMEAAAAYAGDPVFGLHQGLQIEIPDLGVLGYVMTHSPTIGAALSAYRRYNAMLCSGFNLDWRVEGDEAAVRFYRLDDGLLSRHCAEDMTVSLYRLIGRLGHRPVALLDVRFAHEAPPDLAPYEAAFGRRPRFGSGDNELHFAKEVLDWPVQYADERLLALFESMARDAVAQLSESDGWSERVAAWVRACLPATFPTLRETAEHFGVSARTLQYRLKSEGSSYHGICADVRRELALRFLRQGEYSVGDVAYALHFSEPSAFHTTFKKWTGVTPGQYRRGQTEDIARGGRPTGAFAPLISRQNRLNQKK